jgi:hypothetical protein
MDGASRGNFGLMDQVAALHWIQENINVFGGDAGNVTLFGHGHGAAFVHLLMISNMAKGNATTHTFWLCTWSNPPSFFSERSDLIRQVRLHRLRCRPRSALSSCSLRACHNHSRRSHSILFFLLLLLLQSSLNLNIPMTTRHSCPKVSSGVQLT